MQSGGPVPVASQEQSVPTHWPKAAQKAAPSINPHASGVLVGVAVTVGVSVGAVLVAVGVGVLVGVGVSVGVAVTVGVGVLAASRDSMVNAISPIVAASAAEGTSMMLQHVLPGILAATAENSMLLLPARIVPRRVSVVPAVIAATQVCVLVGAVVAHRVDTAIVLAPSGAVVMAIPPYRELWTFGGVKNITFSVCAVPHVVSFAVGIPQNRVPVPEAVAPKAQIFAPV
jgi:hypothetical protein